VIGLLSAPEAFGQATDKIQGAIDDAEDRGLQFLFVASDGRIGIQFPIVFVTISKLKCSRDCFLGSD